MQEFAVETRRHREFVDVTAHVQAAVAASGVRDGIALLFCPHTTASVTVVVNQQLVA